MDKRYCVILAGGIGSRLWPTSRTEKPKQFLDMLGNGETLLQTTYNRFARFIPKENIFVMSNVSYEQFIHEQLPEISQSNILLEPMRRNTIPSGTWATFHILSLNPEACIVFTPSDQVITDEKAFEEDITNGLNYVSEKKRLLSLGVVPARPDTNYGYIQMAEEVTEGIFTVKSFSEKPDLAFATMFKESGEFLWNTGLYIAHAQTYIDTVSRSSSSFQELVETVKQMVIDHKPVDKLIEDTYSRCPNTTFEQSLLEKATGIDVQLCHFGWKDIGSWSEFYEMNEKNENENVVLSDGAMLYDCEGCLIKQPKGKMIVAQGLKDYIIIADNNVLMICKKDDPQAIRRFVNDFELKNNS